MTLYIKNFYPIFIHSNFEGNKFLFRRNTAILNLLTFNVPSMKPGFALLILLFSFIFLQGVNAQSGFSASGLPFKPESPLFGKDIIIQDSTNENQRQVVVCSAFNGWLYAAFTYNQDGAPYLAMLKSEDNGITWSVLVQDYYPLQGGWFASIDIVTTGNSLSNLKLFLSFIATNTFVDDGTAYINRYDGVTGNYEARIFFENSVYDIALTSDFADPAQNSNPNSLGILYSSRSYGSPEYDSIVFLSSSDGGLSLDGKQVVAISSSKYHKVALAYGKSPSHNHGTYFAAWEERDWFGSIPGRIFTAHTNPNFNSPFTTPVNLDGLDPTTTNLCEKPVIACQYKVLDNDSANMTEVVLFEKYQPSSNKHDIQGYYNLQAATSLHFRKLNFTDSTHNNLQPDLKFNPFDSTFILTHFDSSELKLPYLKNNLNLDNPNIWTIVNQNYCDNSNLSIPLPKIEINYGEKEGMNVWIGDRIGGNGVALFDSQNSTYTGFPSSSQKSNTLLNIFPNPCSTYINVEFELPETEIVRISIYNLPGELISTLVDQRFSSGKHTLRLNVSNLTPNCYLYKFESDNKALFGKLVVRP
jgi:hypothetical protein